MPTCLFLTIFILSSLIHFLQADVGHVTESRIDKMKRFISSPLARRKSGSNTSSESNKLDHKIFGTPIEIVAHLTLNESSDKNNLGKQFCIPFVLQRLCQYIKNNSGFMQEGLFRTSGNAKLIERLKCHFDTSGDAPLESEGDIPSAAALLKLFFRELPVPLIPNHLHSSFIEIVQDTINREFIYIIDVHVLVYVFACNSNNLFYYLFRNLLQQKSDRRSIKASG